MTARLLIVDGTNLVMRWASAMAGPAPTEADSAQVCGAVQAAIRNCARRAGCALALIAVDSPGPTWRKSRFPAYKRHRSEALARDGSSAAGTGDWSTWLGMRLTAGGWHVVGVDGFEADDIVATVAVRANGAGIRPAVLSGDSDLLALAMIADCWQPVPALEGRFALRTPEWICERYGLRYVAQLALYKALVGEPGDGLPGVTGIGPKKAGRLLAAYPTAPDLLTSMALRREQKEKLVLALELVALREDVPVGELSSAKLRIPPIPWEDA